MKGILHKFNDSLTLILKVVAKLFAILLLSIPILKLASSIIANLLK